MYSPGGHKIIMKDMATVLVERMQEILFPNCHWKRSLEANKKFKFVIYTAKSKML